MTNLQMHYTVKILLANFIKWYCTNTPISKGKYRLQLLAMKYLKFDERIKYDYFGVEFNLNINSTVGSRLFYFSDYEKDDIQKCLDYLPEESIFFDIGANIGIFSLSLAQKGAKVFAFEPHPLAYLELENHIKTNKLSNIKPFNLACSEVNGQVSFTTAVDSAYSSMHETAYSWSSWKIQKSDQITVPSKTVDTLVSEMNIEKIDLCKIDVEGGELNVLNGMKSILAEQRVKVLLIELNQDTYKGAGYEPKDLEKFLNDYGYFLEFKSAINNAFFVPRKLQVV
jgi:FkbM family methyltransferase